jgi:hypothetical protein
MQRVPCVCLLHASARLWSKTQCVCMSMCTHAPPPRRRKAQLRDVSHLDRKSRLVTAAWRCTRALVPRAGAPPPIEKAIAEVERIASMCRSGSLMKR